MMQLMSLFSNCVRVLLEVNQQSHIQPSLSLYKASDSHQTLSTLISKDILEDQTPIQHLFSLAPSSMVQNLRAKALIILFCFIF